VRLSAKLLRRKKKRSISNHSAIPARIHNERDKDLALWGFREVFSCEEYA